jgi:hypothetical protein
MESMEIPCFNCGTLVAIWPNAEGVFVGCVFCEECNSGTSWSGGTEYTEEREY